MSKEEFLSELRKKLSGLPDSEIEDRISFYSEMIDDRVEEGISEEEAVAKIGSVDTVVKQIMSEIPLKKLVKEKVRPEKKVSAWVIVLLILGFPVWFPLLIAAASVIFSFYVTIWSLVISLYAVAFSLAVGGIAGILCSIFYLMKGNLPGALLFFAAALILAGLTIFLFIACVWSTRGVIKLTGSLLLAIKTSLIGKEAKKDE